MATLLTNKKSTYGSPYCYYTLQITETARTTTTVTVKIVIKAHLQNSTSNLQTGHKLTGYVTLGGTEYSVVIKAEDASWFGTTTHTVTRTGVVISAAAGKDELTGIKFRVTNTGDAGSESCALSKISVPNLDISTVVGDGKVRILSNNTIKASAFTVSSNCRITSADKILWPAFNSGYSYVRFYPDEIRANKFIVE